MATVKLSDNTGTGLWGLLEPFTGVLEQRWSAFITGPLK